MAECAYCKKETELYVGLIPICVACADLSDVKRAARATLFHDLQGATKRADSASNMFVTVTSDIPSGMPHPDGVQRIQDASCELTAARKELTKAHDRLNDFLKTGIVPEDLKRSG